MKHFNKFLTVAFTAVLAVGALAGCSKEDSASGNDGTDFPKKDITIVVPYDAGGGVDLTTRAFTEAAGKDYFNGHSVIVQNMAGGGGSVGQTYVANADADGYTLLAYTSSVVNNPQLKEVTFDYSDFKTLGMVCIDPEILLIPTSAEYQNYEEFVEYAENNTVKVSTSGAMTSHHIFGAKLASELGVEFNYIHCDSAAVQKQELLGGHCDAAIFPLSEIQSEIQDGSVIALGIATEERDENIPDVPTFKELGVDLVDGAFRGFAVSKDVPDEVYQVLRDTFDEIITSEEFITNMKNSGIPYTYMNAEDFQVFADESSKALEEVIPLLSEE